MTDAATPGRAPGKMSFRKTKAPKMAPDCARRQGEITRLAFLLLGREKAIAFLNTEHLGLGARPLDLATASAAGQASVEAELGQVSCR
ncbi:antitoxin Xre/MbcA/ParS toxin-binding domain-containing protein [Altericroceibacterium xinjiangense]|uniref:antitoxin Xre/MbcA/ParS toxin-binding domain-containing protein n=1 Tax=Altericroceibacterium xinjiangense TaxID=762261 RepID=UPI001F498561|nr:antitoxin Xre/MbcA/ParS toxin-binding domain-containing protein [Altericroceibacterium xinjiangense]